MEDSLWYFAFGANMSTDVFLRRRRMRPISTERARLADHRLVFAEPGVPYLEPAFAHVEPRPGSTVHGVLHRLTQPDFDRLTRDESDGYVARETAVHGEHAGSVRARLYVSRRPTRGLLPSRRYLDLVRDGAREHRLPAVERRPLRRQVRA